MVIVFFLSYRLVFDASGSILESHTNYSFVLDIFHDFSSDLNLL